MTRREVVDITSVGAERHRLCLMVEYGLLVEDLPLWIDGSLEDLDGPEWDLAIDEGLRLRLSAWLDLWVRNFEHEVGWTSEETAYEWAMTGIQLFHELETLYPLWDVAVDLWPMPTDDETSVDNRYWMDREAAWTAIVKDPGFVPCSSADFQEALRVWTVSKDPMD